MGKNNSSYGQEFKRERKKHDNQIKKQNSLAKKYHDNNIRNNWCGFCHFNCIIPSAFIKLYK